MEILQQKLSSLQGKFKSIELSENIDITRKRFLRFLEQVKTIGFVPAMDDYDKRKLGIFNQLNFFQLIIGIFIPVTGLLPNSSIPLSACLIACTPAALSVLALWLNFNRKYEAALLSYFILYPFFTCVVYINGMNLGVELHFILYGVLAVFFLQDIGYMLFTIAMSMMSYFILSVVLEHFRYELELFNKPLYLFNQLLALAFIFYGLFLIKKENAGYQVSILNKNRALHKKNIEIEEQKREIGEKAALLNVQKEELGDLNALKDKLFSVIAHDLKAPMYGIRNLFRNMQQSNLPAEEVKQSLPDVVNDLNYTISLMENLLQWAKSQMEAETVKIQTVDVTAVIEDVYKLLHLQAESKQIYIDLKTDGPVYVFADKDMLNLILRNLLSNAIKFTPHQGYIAVGTNELDAFVEVYVQDTGTGISAEALQKINQNNYYSTRGTASESGTGLGLRLCKEFLAKNNGQMHIESEPGQGSTFSFTLPNAE